MARFGSRLGMTRLEAEEYYRLALEAFQKSNLQKAVSEMDRAIELLPNRAEYYAARGFFRLLDAGDDLAAEDFEQALTRNPYEMLANYGQGVLHYRRDEYDAAHEALMKAWATDPNRAETLYYLALTEHRRRNNAQALHWMRQALEHLSDAEDRDSRRRKRTAEKWIETFQELIDKQQRPPESGPRFNIP